MIHPIRSIGSADDEIHQEESHPQEVASSVLSPKKAPGRRRKKSQSQSPPAKDMILLSPDFTPGRLDVICSRGKFAYNSPGNCWFRTMVEEQMDNYNGARTKTEKSLVVSVLVNRVRHANPHGGFVKNYGGRWYRVSDRYSREKVGQQFRDLLHLKYKSSTKAKAEKRKRHGDPDGTEPPELERSSSSLDEGNSFNSYRERSSEANSFNSYRERASEANSFNSTRERRSEAASSFNSSRERASEATSSYTSRERASEANSSYTSRERFYSAETNSSYTSRERLYISEANSSSYTSRERAYSAEANSSSYTSRERAYGAEANSFNSRDRTHSGTDSTPQASTSAFAYVTGESHDGDVAKLPPQNVEGKSGESTFNMLSMPCKQPRRGTFPEPLSSPIKDVLGLEDPQHLDDMELESLGDFDFEPLPITDQCSDHIHKVNFTFGGPNDLHDAFPNIFNPPDLHQPLPGSGCHVSLVKFNEETNDRGSPLRPTKASDSSNHEGAEAFTPFYQPWHMPL